MNFLRVALPFIFCFLTIAATAQDDSFTYENIGAEMKSKTLLGGIDEDDKMNLDILLQLEKSDFSEEIRLLDWALQSRSTRLFDSLKNAGHLSIFQRSGEAEKYTHVNYCLCYGHNQENFNYELQRTDGYKTFKKAYSTKVLERSRCGCATLDYVPTPPEHDSKYYKEAIDAVFVKEKEKLAKYKWTPATYNIWERKQNANSETRLAHTRKAFLYYISKEYDISYK